MLGKARYGLVRKIHIYCGALPGDVKYSQVMYGKENSYSFGSVGHSGNAVLYYGVRQGIIFINHIRWRCLVLLGLVRHNWVGFCKAW